MNISHATTSIEIRKPHHRKELMLALGFLVSNDAYWCLFSYKKIFMCGIRKILFQCFKVYCSKAVVYY